MIELREYQTRVLDTVWREMHHKQNILITAPCSAGKTILFSKIIQRLLRENPAYRALILVDREILVEQSRDKLRSVAPELAGQIGIVCASVSADKEMEKSVTVASRQSLIKLIHNFTPVQLVIIDEAHLMAIPHSDIVEGDQYSKILTKLLEYNQHMRLLGCTASPYRLGPRGGYIYGDQNHALATPYWQTVDSAITTQELLVGQFIAPLTGLVSVDSSMEDDLSTVTMTGGEFNLGQLSNVMCKVQHVNSCVEAWKQHAGDRKKTLIFCATIEHATKVAEAFTAAGEPALAIHSKMNAVEETEAMESLKNGHLRVYTSVAKLTTGMDVIDIDCIVLARPTKSTALYQQMIGRGQRLAPGKEDCLVIDLVGSTKVFGTNMDNLFVQIPRTAPEGSVPEKKCPECNEMVHASMRFCPKCFYQFPVTVKVDGQVGEMEEVKFNAQPEQEPDEIFPVEDVYYSQHQSKKNEKWLIRVEYGCGLNSTFSEWLCLPDFYQGFAVDKARTWWELRTDEPFPETVDEFMFLSGALRQPSHIVCRRDGKYYKVVECVFEEDDPDDEDVFTPYKPYSEMTPEEIQKLNDEIPF